MSKKDKKKENLTALENTETEVEVVETAEEQPSKEQVKADKAESKKTQKKGKNPNKKPNVFVRFGRKCKEVFSELKKVTWPTFAKVVAQTGVVIGVVLVFLVLITAIDAGLSELLKLLTNIG